MIAFRCSGCGKVIRVDEVPPNRVGRVIDAVSSADRKAS